MVEHNQLKNILFFLKVPPPKTGATEMNQLIATQISRTSRFNAIIFPISYSKNVNSLGSLSIKKVLLFFKYFYSLRVKILKQKIDIVYFQLSPLGFAFIRDLMYVMLLKISKAKIVFHLHGKGIDNASKRSFFFKKLYKYCFQNEEIICLSKAISSDVKNVFSGEPYILNNCIDIPINLSTIKKYPKNITITMLSNLHKSKGVFDFIDTIYELNKKYTNIKGKIIGSAGRISVNELNSYINSKKISDKIIYLGALYGSEKYKELLNSDIFIHATHNEAWGLVILEAMACGLPIVSTKEGSIPVMIKDGYNGYLVSKRNIYEIVNKVSSLVEDESLRKIFGKRSKAKYEKYFTCKDYRTKLEFILEDISKKNATTNPTA